MKLELGHTDDSIMATESCTATHAALHITELLEGILLHVPPVQLFPLQRVSRFWKSCIENSPLIQRKLYLRSENPSPANAAEPPATQKPNPFLDRIHIRLNPSQTVHLVSYTGMNGFWLLAKKEPLALTSSARPNADCRPSFRRMLLTQPPKQKVLIQWGMTSPDVGYRKMTHMVVMNKEGVTMEDVMSGVGVAVFSDMKRRYCYKSGNTSVSVIGGFNGVGQALCVLTCHGIPIQSH